jgi:hypothetical protein
VAHISESGVTRHSFGPLLYGPALDLDAFPADPAGEVMVVGAGLALPVQRLAAVVADGVDAAFLAEHLEVAVYGGQADVLAAPPQLGVDLLGTAEAGKVLKRRGKRRGLLRPAHLGSPGGSGAAFSRVGTATGWSFRGRFRQVGLRRGHNRTVQPARRFS